MADRTQLKIADKNDFAEEDPFAELTRIMGFDPRQPVVRNDAGAPAARVEPALDDDFGIDLEKELLGELAGDEHSVAPETYVDANEPAAYAQSAYAPAHEPVAPVFEDEALPPHSREPEFDVDAAFDDALAASFEQGLQLENELIAEPVYAEPEAEFSPAEAPVEPIMQADRAFDEAMEASFEQHFALEDELQPADLREGNVEAPFAYQQRTEADLDADFNAAMANVDMDFAAHEEARYEADVAAEGQLTLGDYQPAEQEMAFSEQDLPDQAQEAAPVAQAEDYDEFERRLHDALDDGEPAFGVADAVAEPAYAPVAVEEDEPVAAAPREEDSLEDELNALLGVMSSQAKALSDPVVVPLRSAAESVVTEPVYATSQWAPELPAEEIVEPAAAASDGYEAADAEEPRFEAEVPSRSFDEPSYDEPALEVEEHDEVSFDDDAFSGAFEQSADPVEPVAPAPIQRAPERPLAASRYEQARSWGLGTPVAPKAEPASEYGGYRTAAYAAPAAAASYAAPAAAAPSYASQAAPQTYAAAEVQAQAHQPEPAIDIHDDLEAELYAAVSAVDDAPEIETVDVPEKAIAIADDLDIPELSFEDDAPPTPAFDDLESEFSSLMHEMNAADTASAPASSGYVSNPYSGGFDREELREVTPAQPIEFPAAAAAGALAAAGAYAGRERQPAYGGDVLAGFEFGSATRGGAGSANQQAVEDDLDYDPDFDEAMASSGLAGAPAAARPARRGMKIAAVVGAVAVIGGLGALAFSFGGGKGAETPVIVKADDGPMKVRPENPGGAVVPNQDNKVYDRVAGATPGAPTQEKLVTNTEEPIDVVAQEAEARANDNPAPSGDDMAAAPAPKSEDRVQQAIDDGQPDASAETAAVAPRKVRTMVVRPDGSLVPREEPAAPPQVAAAEPSDPAPQRVAEQAAGVTGTVPAASAPALAPVPAKPADTASTPASAPIAPQRPSEQPVNVVGEVKPDQVAAIAPSAPVTAAAGGWAMQIASQPSEEAAKSTYQDLMRRYGSVLNGREASIVKAEIAGKGTFWRVRVPAGTRNDAVALCESYKAAGGNCFVSK